MFFFEFLLFYIFFFFFSSRRRHTRLQGDWSSDVCSSDLDLALRSSSATIHRCKCFRAPQRRTSRSLDNPFAKEKCFLLSWPRPIAIRTPSQTPTVSTSGAKRTITCRSASTATCASAPNLLDLRRRLPSESC